MHQEFALGRFGLVSGLDLPDATLAYRTYGKLNEAGDNCVLLPSYYTGTHASYEPWIGPGRMLDPERWFVVAVNMFGSFVRLGGRPSGSGAAVRPLLHPSMVAPARAGRGTARGRPGGWVVDCHPSLIDDRDPASDRRATSTDPEEPPWTCP